MEQTRKQAKLCLNGKMAACMQACYFDFDIRDFNSRMQRGRFDAALRIFRDAVVFPGIVARLCDAPCQASCPRGGFDTPIELNGLEQAAVRHAKRTSPSRYNVALKKAHVAVIGGGISGLACALRLATRKYKITLFEKSCQLGGHIHGLLPSELVAAEIEHEFQHEEICLELDTCVQSLDGLDFDAFYIATGKGGNSFGLRFEEGALQHSDKDGVFLGGSLLGAGSMEAIYQGLQAANAIEAYIKTGRMGITNTGGPESCVQVDLNKFQAMEQTPGGNYSAEDAIKEAGRCIQCDCDFCQNHCDLMAYYGKMPKRIIDEVDKTLAPSSYFYYRISTRLIASCSQCGICKDVCPVQIDMQSFLLDSRREMVRQGAMPKVYSSFWLEDMAHADSGDAAVLQLPGGQPACQYVFFPGCQLGASNPDYVAASYGALTEINGIGSTGLLLRCCGAPALWAGEVELHKQKIGEIRAQWEQMGKPVFIFACPTCKKLFFEFLPEIEGIFLYEQLESIPAQSLPNNFGKTVSVFDPCSSRGEPELQNAVRRLLEKTGYTLSPLPKELEKAQCCSFGGQTAIANPKQAQMAAAQRISQSTTPYVTYCSNCRDIFSAAGKESEHILGLLFDGGDFQRTAPTWSQRRINRINLKSIATQVSSKEEQIMVHIEISQPLRQKISDAYLLEEDCIKTLLHCEQSGRKVYDSQRDVFIGHLLIGHMTHWVEYRPEGDGFAMLNAYAHRLQIKED